MRFLGVFTIEEVRKKVFIIWLSSLLNNTTDYKWIIVPGIDFGTSNKSVSNFFQNRLYFEILDRPISYVAFQWNNILF